MLFCLLLMRSTHAHQTRIHEKRHEKRERQQTSKRERRRRKRQRGESGREVKKRMCPPSLLLSSTALMLLLCSRSSISTTHIPIVGRFRAQNRAQSLSVVPQVQREPSVTFRMCPLTVAAALCTTSRIFRPSPVACTCTCTCTCTAPASTATSFFALLYFFFLSQRECGPLRCLHCLLPWPWCCYGSLCAYACRCPRLLPWPWRWRWLWCCHGCFGCCHNVADDGCRQGVSLRARPARFLSRQRRSARRSTSRRAAVFSSASAVFSSRARSSRRAGGRGRQHLLRIVRGVVPREVRIRPTPLGTASHMTGQDRTGEESVCETPRARARCAL